MRRFHHLPNGSSFLPSVVLTQWILPPQCGVRLVMSPPVLLGSLPTGSPHIQTFSLPTVHPVPRCTSLKHALPASLAPLLPASCGFPVPTESRADPSAKNLQSPVRTEAGLCGRFPGTPSGHLSPCTPQLSQLHVSHFCQPCRALLTSRLIPEASTEPPGVLAFRSVMHKSPLTVNALVGPSPPCPLFSLSALCLVTPVTHAHDVVMGVRMEERGRGPAYHVRHITYSCSLK